MYEETKKKIESVHEPHFFRAPDSVSSEMSGVLLTNVLSPVRANIVKSICLGSV